MNQEALADSQRKLQEQERVNQEALADSQRKLQELERVNQELEREKQLNFDPRLSFFARNATGSHSYRSKSDDGSMDEQKRQRKKITSDAKANAKKIFTSDGSIPLRCVVCGSQDSVDNKITLAHIISSAHPDYDVYGIKNGYKTDLDVFSERNYIPLCGTDGASGSCHDAMDKHLIHIVYNPIRKLYHMVCAPVAPPRFHLLSADAELTPPPGWNPYLRLLAWRSRKCGTEYGFTPDFESFETMNKVSENSNSIGDADSDDGGRNPSTSTVLEAEASEYDG